MAIGGAKTIAEYAIRKWMEQEGFAQECFNVKMVGPHTADITDASGDSLQLIYDPENRVVVMSDDWGGGS